MNVQRVKRTGKGKWGGRREGSGRKRRGPRTRVRHTTRPFVAGNLPVHVTVRVKKGVWNLRSRRSMRVIERAFFVARDRFGVRITHVSVQGNHIHLIAEALSTEALSRGMQGLLVRLAKGLNKMMGRSGKVFEDRFHVHVLRTMREVRNAIPYVLNNWRIHMERLGEKIAEMVDSFVASPTLAIPDAATKPLVVPPRSWKLRTACRTLE